MTAAEGSGGARVMLFAPGRPGPWLEQTERLLLGRRRNPLLEVLVCTDTLEHGAPPPWWRRILTAPAQPTQATAHARQLDQVVRRLYRAGTTPIVLDRVTGRAFRKTGSRKEALLA